ncbi:NACHT domain-containing protein [Cladophialophora immunda]|nr:NACHT domain-containing protein [Cladophialophora immunda]
MAPSKPGGKRHKLHQWLSSHSSTSSSSQTLLPSTPVTPQSTTSTTLTTAAHDFHNRVFSFLSQQDRDTIRQHSVTNAIHVDEIVQQTLTVARQTQTICQSKRWAVAFRGRTVVLREKADNIVEWLDRFKQVGDIVSNVDPVHVGLPWAGIRLLLKAAVSEHSQMEALVLGLEMTLYLSKRLEVYMTYLTAIPPGQARANFESCLVEFHALVLRFLARAIRIYQKGSFARGFDAFLRVEDVSTFEDEYNKLANRAETEARNCDRQNLGMIQKQLEDLRIIHSSVQQLQAKVDLSKLPVATGAAFNSYQDELDARCHPDTRVDILRGIYTWADDINAETIFWINGMAGTGKSTISRTVAQTFSGRGQLGASFFFKRGEPDRENARLFYPTIAHELVCQIPGLSPFVQKAVEDDPRIADRALKEQFEKLVFQPLTHISPIQTAFVLVIDALDECSREGDIRIIISQLARTRKLNTIRFRVFLTSRPELSIRLGFARINTSTHRDIVLQDIPPATIEHDVSVYLRDEFARIRGDHGINLPSSQFFAPDWPGTQALNTLTQLAVPLFIVAATICRFVGELKGSPNPLKRLSQILNQPIGQKPQLELTYLPIISQILVGDEDAKEKEERWDDFRRIIGSIVLLADPLSATSLARLLDVQMMEVDCQLRSLHSVLWIRDYNAPIHLLHLSFREFLTKKVPSDTGRPFQIDECDSHGYLADKCLALLKSSTSLRKDICQLGDPGSLRTEIDAALIKRCIPQHLQYACRYWVYHAKQSGHRIRDKGDIDRFLQQHFFHWLECLSLLGRISDSIRLIDTLQSLVAENNSEISAFLEDARRFVLTFHFILSHAPLQVYGSGWHFSPLQSRVRSFFKEQRLENIELGQ